MPRRFAWCKWQCCWWFVAQDWKKGKESSYNSYISLQKSSSSGHGRQNSWLQRAQNLDMYEFTYPAQWALESLADVNAIEFLPCRRQSISWIYSPVSLPVPQTPKVKLRDRGRKLGGLQPATCRFPKKQWRTVQTKKGIVIVFASSRFA